MHGNSKRHRVRKARDNRVPKEKRLIKREARRHIGHKAYDTQDT